MNLFICFFIYFNILIVSLIRGGEGFSSIIGLNSCSFPNWILLILIQCFCFLTTSKFIAEEKKSNQTLNDNRMNFGIFVGSYIAGIISGSLGVGGGIVINPLLLKHNYTPDESAAISGFIVLFTSLSTSTQFLIAGAFNFKIAILVLILSGIGSLMGYFILRKLIDYYKKPSLIVWMLFGLLFISFLSMPLLGLKKMLAKADVLTFNKPC